MPKTKDMLASEMIVEAASNARRNSLILIFEIEMEISYILTGTIYEFHKYYSLYLFIGYL